MNFEKQRQLFLDFVKEFENQKVDENYNKMTELKIRHSFSVRNYSVEIAKSLNLNNKDTELASTIGLLHDIGRFTQIKNDKSSIKFDHAEEGVKILFDEGLIFKFYDDTNNYKIIKEAIFYHNKKEIYKGLSEREILFCKIIRDADKLDNLKVQSNGKIDDNFPKFSHLTLDKKISDDVYKDFMNQTQVDIANRKTIFDWFLCMIAFVYDLNFEYSKKYVKDNNLINKLFNEIKPEDEETKSKLESMKECLKNYIEVKSIL